MASFVNQHSFVILAAGLWLGLAVLLLGGIVRRIRRLPAAQPADVYARRLLALGVVAAALLGVWLSLRSGPGTMATADVDAALGRGQPVLVEFYSDY